MEMSEKGFSGAPFGSQSYRFTTSGVHPKNLVPGTFLTHGDTTFSTSNEIGPGKYNPEYGGFSSKAVVKRASGPGWQREYELSHMLALPHLLNKEEWEQKKLLVQKLGPGTYSPKDIMEKKDVSTRGLLDLQEPRFKETIKVVCAHCHQTVEFGSGISWEVNGKSYDALVLYPGPWNSCIATPQGPRKGDVCLPYISHNDAPGPGAYGIPHAVLDLKNHESFGSKGMLESGGDGVRTLPTVGSHLGPGTYSFEDTIDQMLKKRTSVRGPYDLFTADRSKPILTGHYATLANNNLSPGEYEYKSGIDEMQSSHKRTHGQFSRLVKYPRRPHDRITACTLALCPRDPVQINTNLSGSCKGNTTMGFLLIYCEGSKFVRGSDPPPFRVGCGGAMDMHPGPGQYDPKRPGDRPLTQGKNLPGFLSSSQRADKMATKFFTGNFNSVGPGRYDVQKFEDLQDVNGHQSDFRSKTSRPEGERLKFLQERIKDKNVPLQQRLVLVDPNEPKRCVDTPKTAMRYSNLMSDMTKRRAVTVS